MRHDVPAQVPKKTGAAGLAVVRVAAQAMQFALFLVAAQLMTPAEFGIFSLAFALTVGVSVLAEAGWREYVICAEPRAATRFANMVSLASGSFWAGLVIAAGGLCWILDVGIAYLPAALTLSLWIWLRPLAMVQTGLLTRDSRLGSVALVQAASEAIGFAVALAALFAGQGVLALALGKAALVLVELGSGLLLNRPHAFPWADKAMRHEMSRFSRRILGARMLQYLQGNVGTLLMGLALAPAAVGLYRAAVRIVGAAQEVIREPTRLYGWSALRAAHVADRDEAGEAPRTVAAVLGIASVSALLAGPVFIVIGLTGDLLVKLLLGSGWQGTAPLTMLLSFAACARLLAMLVEPLLSLKGRADMVQRNAFGMLLLNMVCLAGSVPFGLMAVAWAELLSALLSIPLTLHMLQRYGRMPLRSLIGALAMPLLIWVLSAVAVLLLRQQPWLAAQPVFAQIGAAALAVLALQLSGLAVVRRAVRSPSPLPQCQEVPA